MTIRTANLHDLDAICLLAEEIVTSHSAQAPQVFAGLPGFERDREFWQGCITQDGMMMFIAEADGQLEGFISARMLPLNPLPFILPRRVCAIGTIVVAQIHQRRGIGRQLFAAVQGWAQEQGAVEIKLEVFDFNRGAIAMYEDAGFKVQSHIMSKAIATQE